MKASRLAAATGGATLLTLTLLAIPGPAAVAAPPDQSEFPIPVEALDARRAEIFASVDTNGDGLISAAELDAHEGPMRPGRGRHHGRRGKQQPSEEERAAMDAALFTSLDQNGDGVLGADEFSSQALREARRDLMQSRFFSRADANGDGYLSPDEFPPRRLSSLDADGDGLISRDELPRRLHRSHAG